MLSIAFAFLVSAASLVSADSTCARTYTVQTGDYCDLISAAQNASTYQIAVANYQTINDACSNLQIGQAICLGNVGQDCQSVYTVQGGDSCDAVSLKFGINSTMLQTNNPQIDEACDNIYVGEVLCVAPTALVTPPPAGWTLPGADLDDGSGSSAFSTISVAPSPTVLPDNSVDSPDITVTLVTTVTVTSDDSQATSTATDSVTADGDNDDNDDNDDDGDDDCDDGSDDDDDDADDATNDDGSDDDDDDDDDDDECDDDDS